LRRRNWGEPERELPVSTRSASADSAHCRPPGKTGWSKALARHGADARVALAGVLGVPAKDIWVRDRAD